MRIMSYNILCYGNDEHKREDRISLVMEMIERVSPDSFGVQEATPDWMKDLRKMLPDYDSVGVGRDDGDDKGEYSAVFFKKDLYELVESDTFWLSETPDTPSKGWDGACTRICTYAVLKNKKTGEKFVHVNTHLDHIGPVARTKGVDLVLDKAESFGLPVVVTGDFNLNEGCDLYNHLVSKSIKDSKYLAKSTENKITFNGFDNCPAEIIDYVLVSPHFEVETYKVMDDKIDGKYPSDHYPVYADLK